MKCLLWQNTVIFIFLIWKEYYTYSPWTQHICINNTELQKYNRNLRNSSHKFNKALHMIYMTLQICKMRNGQANYIFFLGEPGLNLTNIFFTLLTENSSNNIDAVFIVTLFSGPSHQPGKVLRPSWNFVSIQYASSTSTVHLVRTITVFELS